MGIIDFFYAIINWVVNVWGIIFSNIAIIFFFLLLIFLIWKYWDKQKEKTRKESDQLKRALKSEIFAIQVTQTISNFISLPDSIYNKILDKDIFLDFENELQVLLLQLYSQVREKNRLLGIREENLGLGKDIFLLNVDGIPAPLSDVIDEKSNLINKMIDVILPYTNSFKDLPDELNKKYI